MRRFMILAAFAFAAAACQDSLDESSFPVETIDSEIQQFGRVVVTDGSSEVPSNPRFSQEGFEQRDPVHDDKTWSQDKDGPALSPAVRDEVFPGSAVMENGGVTIYALDRETVRLRQGNLTRDVRVAPSDQTLITSDGRYMVRAVNTLGWTVYSVDGSTAAFTQPSNVIVFDAVGDTILMGHKHDGVRTLHSVLWSR